MKRNSLFYTPNKHIPIGEFVRQNGKTKLYIIDKKHHREDTMTLAEFVDAWTSVERDSDRSSLEESKSDI